MSTRKPFGNCILSAILALLLAGCSIGLISQPPTPITTSEDVSVITEGALLISTHLITDVEKLLDEVVFLKEGEIILSGSTEDLRVEKKRSIEGIYKEIFS